MSDFRLVMCWFFSVLCGAFCVDYLIGDYINWDDAIAAFMLLLLSSVIIGSTCFLLWLKLQALWRSSRIGRISMPVKERHEWNA